jgi:hypothetical protein
MKFPGRFLPTLCLLQANPMSHFLGAPNRGLPTLCWACVAAMLLGLYLSLTALRGFAVERTEADAASASLSNGRKRAVMDYNIPQIARINEQIRQGWEGSELTPSGPATDAEWCRRLFLDLLGRIPTVEELSKFEADRTPHKKLRLVNELLSEDGPYVEEYARNWTTLWTNILIGRAGGTDAGSLINRTGLQQSLRRALQRNKPYDRFVYEIVNASGSGRPGEENFNGFVNFLAGNLADNGIEATAKTAQIFLGVQVRCTQCHNHPFNEWKQNQFWEFNAFFRQTQALRRFVEGSGEINFVELANEDFGGEDGNTQEAVLFYELRNGLTKAAYPVFFDGTELSKSGYLSEVNRREELAKWMVKSDYLGKALVNRMWAHFMGYGFTKPLDDMGPHNAPTHPELLDELGKDIRQHSYDLKELIRWIVLSEPYSLSSRFSARNKKDDPSLGEKPMFSRFYLRQMRAEELYQSLLTATEALNIVSAEEQEKQKREWLSQFVIAFGTDDNEETTTFNGTIPQTLMMMNGELIKKATSVEKGSFLQRLAANPKLKSKGKVDYLYRAALGRIPTSTERSLADQLTALRKGDAVAALQDVWWAVLNSNEFILNH